MTAKRTRAPRGSKAQDAADRAARGSVTEAIGKLIGDDAARDRGTAEKQAGADAAPAGKNPAGT